jgi:hypothetical protein
LTIPSCGNATIWIAIAGHHEPRFGLEQVSCRASRLRPGKLPTLVPDVERSRYWRGSDLRYGPAPSHDHRSARRRAMASAGCREPSAQT